MAAFSRAEIEQRFGKFSYTEGKGGVISPDPAWSRQNIVIITLPFPLPVIHNGKTRQIKVHHLVAQSLVNALTELQEMELEHLIKTFDGSYVPRHVLWKADKPLSTHSWGIALDLNAAWFPYGSQRKQDDRLVRCFARYGFACGQVGGGLWAQTADPMHFEYCYRGK